jgi:hypothetical protein
LYQTDGDISCHRIRSRKIRTSKAPRCELALIQLVATITPTNCHPFGSGGELPPNRSAPQETVTVPVIMIRPNFTT